MQLNIKQIKAIDNAINYKFSIINGGAGTGKTTIIKEIHNKLDKSASLLKLVAPTGKAASRLREASGISTSTIHSLLKYNGETFMCKDLRGYDIVIDEASMVDSYLLASLINTNPNRIVLIGDQAQLFPVGIGSPFHDLIRYKLAPVTTLDICYRNSEAIFHNALQIRNQKLPLREQKSKNEIWKMQNTGSAKRTEDTIIDIVKQNVLDFEQDIILVTRNGSVDNACTRASLNVKIAKQLNKWNDTKGDGFVVGARVICSKNFTEHDVYNGTTGTITGIDDEGDWYVKGDIKYYQNGQWLSEIKYTKEVRDYCDLAYALTVHKSQGSQYRKVIFICLASDSYTMLNNSLIYTAVTRAKKNCIILGDLQAFDNGVQKNQSKDTIIDLLVKD